MMPIHFAVMTLGSDNTLLFYDQPDVPLVLGITLQVSRLCFADRVYSGKIVGDRDHINDCELCLFARDLQGEPLPHQAIGLEIVKVGKQRSITAEYLDQDDFPILWYGQHALWMDGETGKTVGCPDDGLCLERLARGVIKRLQDLEDLALG